MKYVGKNVFIYFKDREAGIYGTLGYVDEFSAKHDYRRPNDFYINHTSFKASHIRKLKEKDPCLTCSCWDSDAEGCTMPHSDKWYACPIESAKPENQKALEEMAAEYAEKHYYEHLEEVAGRKEDTL